MRVFYHDNAKLDFPVSLSDKVLLSVVGTLLFKCLGVSK